MDFSMRPRDLKFQACCLNTARLRHGTIIPWLFQKKLIEKGRKSE